MYLPPLFHWSPLERRERIRAEGLRPYTDPTLTSAEGAEWAMGCGVICFGTTPSAAWGLSGMLVEGIETWDLWQVNLEDSDEVHIRAEFGPRIKEVRVRNPIAADRLWWVGERNA